MRRCSVALSLLSCLALVGCAMPGEGPEPSETVEEPVFEPTDRVYLEDGTVLVAQVQRLADGKLTVKTKYAGELELNRSEVVGLTTTDPMNVRLEGEGPVRGVLKYEEGRQRLTVTEGPGQAASVDELDAIWGIGEDSPEEAARKAEIERQRPKWTSSAEVGVSGRTGNTERVTSMALIEAKRETPDTRLNFYGRALHSREDGEDSQKEFIGGAGYEHDISDRTYGFLRVELENDIFEDISFRATAAGGLGYFLIEEEDHTLKVSGGAGAKYEEYYSGGNDCTPVAQAGVEYMRELQEWLLFEHATFYEPSLEDSRQYWVKTQSTLAIPITMEKDWRFKIGVRQEYTAVPEPGVDRLDTFYFASLVWTFQ